MPEMIRTKRKPQTPGKGDHLGRDLASGPEPATTRSLALSMLQSGQLPSLNRTASNRMCF
jgi:hypothetical protein